MEIKKRLWQVNSPQYNMKQFYYFLTKFWKLLHKDRKFIIIYRQKVWDNKLEISNILYE